jgi:hypothetical protein
MSACDKEPCKTSLLLAAKAKKVKDDFWEMVIAAATAAGFCGGGAMVEIPEGAITDFIAAKTAEAAAVAAIPGLG